MLSSEGLDVYSKRARLTNHRGSADTSPKKLESARFLNVQHDNVAVILAVGKAGWITGLYFEKSGCCLQQVEAGINLLQH